MAEDLKDIIARLDYCVDERHALDAQIAKHFNTYLEGRTIPSPTPNPGEVYEVRLTQALPKAVTIRVGSIIHEVRSSLDELACRLAERNGQTVDKVYFPISKNQKVFDSDGLQKIKKLSAQDQAIIIAMQPHGDANPVLFGLHDFDRTRKHQRLLASSKGGRAGMFEGDATGVLAFDLEEFTTNWQALAFIPKGVLVKFKVGYAVCFDEPPQIKGMNVLVGLDIFITKAQELVRKFL